MLYPMKLKAPLKDYLWGGTKLKDFYNKTTDLEKVAESWELSCHKDGASEIVNGEAAGQTLAAYIKTAGNEILGEKAAKFPYFPLLIKLIDAKDNLSVQVHPGDEYALRVEGEYGKTEMWYIVDCEPGASLLYGFTKVLEKEEFRRRIADNTLLEVCNKVPVKKGDVFFIESGTLHAIGKGILIAEIQQNSNTTYRIYDYDRRDKDGNPRELHVDKAVEVTNLKPPRIANTDVLSMDFMAGGKLQLLSKCGYFTVYHADIDGICHFKAGKESFQAVTALSGSLCLQAETGTVGIGQGDTVFIPAGMGEYRLEGKGEIIFSML